MAERKQPAAKPSAGRAGGTGRRASPKAKPPVDLTELGARVVSVFAKGSRVLIEMPADKAAPLLGKKTLSDARRSVLLDAMEQQLAALRERAPELADSALAASAVAMAFEIEHPFNSATSKSMCQARLAEALKEMRALAPPEEKRDGLDEVGQRRAQRRSQLVAGSTDPAAAPRS